MWGIPQYYSGIENVSYNNSAGGSPDLVFKSVYHLTVVLVRYQVAREEHVHPTLQLDETVVFTMSENRYSNCSGTGSVREPKRFLFIPVLLTQ